MKSFEALTNMGIQNPTEIIKYTHRQEGHGDVLKIYYKRQKGSFLPNSRKYKFARTIKTIIADGGKQEFENVSEISPFLLTALEELDSVVKHKNAVVDQKGALLDDIRNLENAVANGIADLRSQIEKLS